MNNSYEGKLGTETIIYSRWFDPITREYIYLKQVYYIPHDAPTETIIGKRFWVKKEEVPPEFLKRIKEV